MTAPRETARIELKFAALSINSKFTVLMVSKDLGTSLRVTFIGNCF